MKQRCRLGILFFASLLMPALHLQAQWVQYESPHFQLATDGKRGRAISILQQCERLRWFFAQQMQLAEPLVKPRLLVFDSDVDFYAFRPTDAAAAFYVNLPYRDYIVIGPNGSGNSDDRITAHEFVHLLQQQSGTKLPIWLSEGMAEVYSTLQVQGDQVVVGLPVVSAKQLLRREWLSLPQVFGANRESPLYNSRNHAGNFYSVSWAVTHFLMLHPGYQAKWPTFLKAIAKEISTEDALRETYNLSVEELDKLVNSYVRRESYAVPLRQAMGSAPKLSPQLAASAMSRSAVKTVRADAALAVNDFDRSLGLALEAIDADPTSYEPQLTLAYSYWRMGNFPQASRVFLTAAELGAPHPEAITNAMALQTDQSRMARILPLIEALVKKHPDHARPVLMLCSEWMRTGRYEEAYQRVTKLKRPIGEDLRNFYSVLVQSAWFTQRYAEAESAVSSFVALAKEQPRWKADAERWRQFLKDAKEPLPEKGDLTLTEHRHFPPRSFRPGTGDPTESAELAPNFWMSRVKQLEGTLETILCQPEPWRFVVNAQGKNFTFVFDKPNEVLINRGEGGSQEFQCGPQKQQRVLVYYKIEPSLPPDTTGAVRRLDFLP